MANILTSYIRIIDRTGFKTSSKDNHATNQEVNLRLFESIVQAYGKFGSHHVPILMTQQQDPFCLDIQFGSSKRYQTENYILEDKHFIDTYYVWERIADEGGFNDQICQYKWDSNDSMVINDYRDCTYGFDRIRFFGSNVGKVLHKEYALDIDKESMYNSVLELPIKGDYYGCNSRALVDTNKSPEMYRPHTPENFFAFTDDGMVNEIHPSWLSDFFVFGKIEKNAKKEITAVELLWNGRIVQKVVLQYDERYVNYRCFSADFWDNCIDSEYAKFVESLKKRL